jgi:antitoxin (DNA-binding transcriptional repressor) of toxin-antitoxin stability system
MIMIRINIHEAKARLSEYLERIRRGEVLIICKRNIPVAEVRAIPSRRTARRPVGLARGEFEVPRSFFEPLPDDVLDGFEGDAER